MSSGAPSYRGVPCGALLWGERLGQEMILEEDPPVPGIESIKADGCWFVIYTFMCTTYITLCICVEEELTKECPNRCTLLTPYRRGLGKFSA
jgi:hypothetical protein